MEIRHPLHPDHGAILDTEELRSHFLIDKVFVPGEISLTYSHVDRIIIGGICPLEIPLSFDESIGKQIGSNYLLERRELGVINLGTGTGKVVADGSEYLLEPEEALYLGLGIKDIEFSSVDTTKPAMFYMASAPAHKNYPTKKITKDDVIKEDLGTQENCNVRTIHKYFVPDVLPTCQLCLGLTRLAPGSNWNTMPTHTHERRMEVYFYMDMDEDSVVFHMMGEPTETRHIVMRNHQAVISPSWSIHSGVGTKNYAFIWAMIGENQVFGDMDFVDMKDLR